MVRSLEEWRRGEATALPAWVKPQLTKLVDAPPEGPEWLHEIKFDGYRMHARLDRGAVRLLTRTGLDWTHKYPGIAATVSSLPARQAYLDGELCGVRPDGSTSFSLIQNASDAGNGEALSSSCSTSSISTARPSARSRSTSGRSAFGSFCRTQARLCNSAITRSDTAGPSMSRRAG